MQVDARRRLRGRRPRLRRRLVRGLDGAAEDGRHSLRLLGQTPYPDGLAAREIREERADTSRAAGRLPRGTEISSACAPTMPGDRAREAGAEQKTVAAAGCRQRARPARRARQAYVLDGRLNDSFTRGGTCCSTRASPCGLVAATSDAGTTLRAGDFLVDAAAGGAATIADIAKQTGVDFTALKRRMSTSTLDVRATSRALRRQRGRRLITTLEMLVPLQVRSSITGK